MGSKKPKKPKKGAWLGIFQPKWQNYKIVISPAGNIGSIPNFDRVIKPHIVDFVGGPLTHSWVVQNNKIHIQDGGRPPYCRILETSKLAYQWTDLDETWVVASHHVPDMSAMLRLPWQRPLPSNGALYIQQLWASAGRTREPILLKFGTQQQIRITITVM